MSGEANTLRHAPRPDGVEDEEELDEDAAKRQDAAHDHAWHRLRVQRLFRDLAWDLVRADGMLDGAPLETHVRAHEGERQRDQEPKGKQADQRGEGDGGGGALGPQDQVQDEEEAEHDTGTESARQQDVQLPLGATEALVEACCHVASRRAQTHEQHHGAGHEGTTIGRRQEAEASEQQRDQRHAEHLGT